MSLILLQFLLFIARFQRWLVDRQSPAIAAFFDEMRLFGFIEGQNLTVLPNGFGVRNDELDERAEALVKAAPDVIISGPVLYCS